MDKDKDLTLEIRTSQGTWENATFEKTAKVQEVIDAVVEHFGFASNGNYQLQTEDGEVLKPQRPLVSYKIEDGDVLVFTDLGGAVWQ